MEIKSTNKVKLARNQQKRERVFGKCGLFIYLFQYQHSNIENEGKQQGGRRGQIWKHQQY